ncbi:DUF3426 domain-containing protein [Alkalimarinus alittae]|uniref:Zinc-ribbon domain-containing protein n=1 Tax=Alkalimarinus alittae TaxID=2961619 RepID=A0ABY6N3M1_9ALTE|nr:DUF3426 domain-containing protein [Alkalimarinus alittae]UZE96716.1 zinc-ribbon domain-containing protein [Alkalimarinus alittae]
MSNTHLTQCPHCQATFKVQDQHLNAAGGKVRCGSCLEVFNALENLTQSAQPKPAPTSQPQAPQKPLTETSDTHSPETSEPQKTADENDDDEFVFADNPDEDSEDEGYTGPGTFSSELSDSFLELGEGGSSHFSDHKLDDDLNEDLTNKKAGSDESWAEKMLEDIETNKSDHSAKKPTAEESDSFSAEFAALDQENSQEEIAIRAPQVEPPTHDDANVTQANHTPPIKAEQSQRYASTDLSHQYQNLQVDPLDLPNASGRSIIGTFIWSTLNILLLVTLLAQLSWFHYDKLAQFEQLRPFYEKGCQLVGCQLPDLVDTTKIKSQNLVVRSHPTARKALIIDTVIVNQAPYDQPFPNLALYFSDLNNNVIAQRLFEPSDYLSGEIKNWPAMPKNTPIHISIEILDPGKNAVNYKIDFFKHTAQN